MPTIDIGKISQEVNEKYSVVSNAFRLATDKSEGLDSKGKPKDLVVCEVGDVKQQEFFPQVKLARWGDNEEVGEVNFSIRLIDNEKGTETVKTEGEKIIWEKGNIKIENYDFTEDEGGYKFVPILKAKPATNKLRFLVKRKGLDFFKQPAMTEEHLEEGQTADETHIYDLEGNVVAERPINVVNSFAIYHKTKGGMNDKDGKEYKCGKAFHDFRPHFFDANGLEAWGDIDYIWQDEENGERIVTIPQEFLDTAVYPIKSNDTFGYTTLGSTGNVYIADNDVMGPGKSEVRSGTAFTLGVSGTLDSIHVGLETQGGDTSVNVKAFVSDKDSAGSNSHGQVAAVTRTSINASTHAFFTFTASSESLSADTYVLNCVGDSDSLTSGNTIYVYYDAAASVVTYYGDGALEYDSPENPWGSGAGYAGYKLSIYATYTAGVSSAVKDIIQSGFLAAPR